MTGRLHARLSAVVPSYLVPKYWVLLTFMPMTTNCKIDRRALSMFITTLSTREKALFTHEIIQPGIRSSQPLSTTKEKIIGQCVQEVLETDTVYRDSNFFSLSGDSISAIRLCALLRNRGIIITVKEIYLRPTIAQQAVFARYTSYRLTDTPSYPYGTIQKTPIMSWFLWSCKKNPHWYNQSYVLKLSKAQDLERIELAWETIVAMHPMLRFRTHIGQSGIEVTIPDTPGTNDFRVFWWDVLTEQQVFDLSLHVQSGLHLGHGPISALDCSCWQAAAIVR